MDPIAASRHARTQHHQDLTVFSSTDPATPEPGARVATPFGSGTVVRSWPEYRLTGSDVSRGTARVPRLLVRLDGAEPGVACLLVPVDEAEPIHPEPEPDPESAHVH